MTVPPRTLYPTVRLGARVWHLYVHGDALYRICAKGAQWRLQEKNIYGGRWHPVPDLDVPTFLAVHHCRLADA